MNFETVLFGTAFLLLAAISIPNSDEAAQDAAEPAQRVVVLQETQRTGHVTPLLLSETVELEAPAAQAEYAQDQTY